MVQEWSESSSSTPIPDLDVVTELEQAADLRKRDEINRLGRIGAAGDGASWRRP